MRVDIITSLHQISGLDLLCQSYDPCSWTVVVWDYADEHHVWGREITTITADQLSWSRTRQLSHSSLLLLALLRYVIWSQKTIHVSCRPMFHEASCETRVSAFHKRPFAVWRKLAGPDTCVVTFIFRVVKVFATRSLFVDSVPSSSCRSCRLWKDTIVFWNQTFDYWKGPCDLATCTDIHRFMRS